MFYKVVRKKENRLFSYNSSLPECLQLEYVPGIKTVPHNSFPTIFVFDSLRRAEIFILLEEEDCEIWECEGKVCENQDFLPLYPIYLPSSLDEINKDTLANSLYFKPPFVTVYLEDCTLIRKVEDVVL